MRSLALIHHSFGPYHFARAEKLLAAHPGPLHLIQLASGEQLREWKAHRRLAVRTVAEGKLEALPPADVSKRLLALLDELSPEVLVLAGYAHAAFRRAAKWARRERRAAVLLSDSQGQDKSRSLLKETAKRVWVQHHFQTAFTAGALGAQYLGRLGFSSDRIWRGYDVVDNDAFARKAAEARTRAGEVRAKHRLPERFFLFAGRLAPEKNVHVLIDAWAKSKASQRVGLVLAGNGPELLALRARAARHEGVAFPGFLQEAELAELYALCEALVLPSRSEPWGLVVNEAMACGAPVIVSSACGAAADLVFAGVNGFVVPPGEVDALAEAIENVASDARRREEMGEASRRIIAPWSTDAWAKALCDCARAAARAVGR